MVILENHLVHTSCTFKSGKLVSSCLFIQQYNISFVISLALFFSFQFGLPRVEKEQFEKEDRAEIQQEILKKVARNLPVYTRTAGGGETITKTTI